MSGDPYVITSLEALDALYDAPRQTSLVKERDHVTEDYRRFIEAAPFALIATRGAQGIDISPRGDPAPLVSVDGPRRLLLPDRRGNNRIDTLRNLVADPEIGLIFLVPGVGETIRVRGRATITTDPALRERFEMRGQRPASVIDVRVTCVYFQCQKAIARSRLWDPEARVLRDSLPSTGSMLEAMSEGGIDGAAYDAEYPERMARTIY